MPQRECIANLHSLGLHVGYFLIRSGFLRRSNLSATEACDKCGPVEDWLRVLYEDHRNLDYMDIADVDGQWYLSRALSTNSTWARFGELLVARSVITARSGHFLTN